MTTAIALSSGVNNVSLAIDLTLTNYKHLQSPVEKYFTKGPFIFLVAGPHFVTPLFDTYLEDFPVEDISTISGYYDLWKQFLLSEMFLSARSGSDHAIQVIVCDGHNIALFDHAFSYMKILPTTALDGSMLHYCAVGSGADFVEGALALNCLVEEPLGGKLLLKSLMEVASTFDPGTGSITNEDNQRFLIFNFDRTNHSWIKTYE